LSIKNDLLKVIKDSLILAYHHYIQLESPIFEDAFLKQYVGVSIKYGFARPDRIPEGIDIEQLKLILSQDLPIIKYYNTLSDYGIIIDLNMENMRGDFGCSIAAILTSLILSDLLFMMQGERFRTVQEGK